MNKIVVLPREIFKRVLFDRPTIVPFEQLALISICSYPRALLLDAEKRRLLKKRGCRHMLTQFFGDYTDKSVVDPPLTLRSSGKRSILFSEMNAKKIISFLDGVKIDQEVKILIVHCDAGISRSGAVGLFACRYLKCDSEKFYRENETILPNPYICKVLMDVSGLTLDYQTFWDNPRFKGGSLF